MVRGTNSSADTLKLDLFLESKKEINQLGLINRYKSYLLTWEQIQKRQYSIGVEPPYSIAVAAVGAVDTAVDCNVNDSEQVSDDIGFDDCFAQNDHLGAVVAVVVADVDRSKSNNHHQKTNRLR